MTLSPISALEGRYYHHLIADESRKPERGSSLPRATQRAGGEQRFKPGCLSLTPEVFPVSHGSPFLSRDWLLGTRDHECSGQEVGRLGAVRGLQC